MKIDLLLRLATYTVGDSEPECRAFAFYGVCSNPPVRLGCDSLGDGKSWSGSLLVFVLLHETPGHVRQFVCRDTCSDISRNKVRCLSPHILWCVSTLLPLF